MNKSTKSDIGKACAANGFSPAAAVQMIKWRAGGAASNAWLERYKEQAGKRTRLPVNQSSEPSKNAR